MGKKLPSLVIAAGGTGGHIFPAQAMSEYIINKRIYSPTFVTDTRGSAFFTLSHPLLKNGLVIPTIRFSLRNIFRLPLDLARFAASVVKLAVNFWMLNPVAVIGFGGYASFPALLSAVALRIPIILHESNAVMGRTNRMFMPFASTVMLSFPNTRGISPRFMHKVKITGTPVRSSISDISKQPNPPHDGLKILVIGGSQGAKTVSESVPLAISQLSTSLRDKLTVWQQVREEYLDKSEKIYKKALSNFMTATFFPDTPGSKDSISDLMQQADLVIARAGASTISEIMTLGKASILIPFAAAKDNHQYYNALNLVENEAALMVEEGKNIVSDLTAAISLLLIDSKKRTVLAKKSYSSIHLESTASMVKILKDIGK